ncbi:hypothetical protein [Butyrivibrio sp. INlla16]|uniref:hypothetical protein n=1 Tax=Butyrivibrio sp. INlla16 TaxID=1520807 RepID=UPI00088744E0|nr:hypothetical protein [Butyrivibrio sp. INlla16]SDB11033.1 hypothetical protein SAMN02910263_00528 [Butyrivibrio sp. INlla16]
MRITGSTVNLVSERRYTENYSFTRQNALTTGQTIGDTASEFKKALMSSEASRLSGEKEELFTNYNADGGFAITGESPNYSKVSEIENIRMQIMERLLNIMQILYGQTGGGGRSKMQEYMRELSSRIGGGSYQWMSVSTATYVHTQEEYTAFSAQGIARTEDGREISFGVGISMTSQFTEAVGITQIRPAQLIDPLVINVGSGVTEISDQTFTFDLDCDGTLDEVKSIGPGSGFLAYDRNGDGVIGDGSELFGAKSGDGFMELSEFDSDNNGWIDENDAIYEKLRVWCRGEDGKDSLMTLKEADVGAIFLGNAETKFTSQGSDFAVNAQFKASGIFLRESTGEAGAVHQIDLAKLA